MHNLHSGKGQKQVNKYRTPIVEEVSTIRMKT